MRCPLLYAVAKPKPRKYLGSLGRGATHNPRGHWGRLGLRGSLLDRFRQLSRQRTLFSWKRAGYGGRRRGAG
jgi:hypothetical protein